MRRSGGGRFRRAPPRYRPSAIIRRTVSIKFFTSSSPKSR